MIDSLDLIGPDRRDAARAALAAAFGARSVADLTLLKGGISGASIYRVGVGERTYVLRLEPERVARHHRQRGFASMAAAAQVGVAPAVHYADAEAGVAVMDFVEARPLAEHPGGAAGLVRELGELIRLIQQSPPFPPLDVAGDVIETLLVNLAASGLFAPGLLDRHAEGLARLRQVCPWNPSSFVSSHNDPNPRNLLFDGRRLWLVDWELAFRHDPQFDVAIVTTETAATPELEDVLVAAAFGRPADQLIRARLRLMRLITRLFYGCIALEAFAADPPATPDPNLDALSPSAFRAAAAEGRFASGETDIGYAFGKMSLAAFIDGLAALGAAEALSTAT